MSAKERRGTGGRENENQCSQVSADSDIKYMAVLDSRKLLGVCAYLI